MSNEKVQPTEMSLLLPWYVNGTLAADERDVVEQHLQGCEECRQAVSELRNISGAIEKGEPTPLVPEPPVADFLQKTLANKAPASPVRRMQWWSIAASLLAVIAASYWIFVSIPEENIFRTVTDPGGSTEIAYVFDIETAGRADDSIPMAVAERFTGSDIVQTGSGYRLTVSMPSATMKDLHEYAGILEQIDGVQSVSIIGVHLPLE